MFLKHSGIVIVFILKKIFEIYVQIEEERNARIRHEKHSMAHK